MRALGEVLVLAVTGPQAARHYRDLLLDAGPADVAVEVRTPVLTGVEMLTGLAATAHTAGAVTGEQAAVWTAEQTGRARAGRLLAAIPIFVAAGGRCAGQGR